MYSCLDMSVLRREILYIKKLRTQRAPSAIPKVFIPLWSWMKIWQLLVLGARSWKNLLPALNDFILVDSLLCLFWSSSSHCSHIKKGLLSLARVIVKNFQITFDLIWLILSLHLLFVRGLKSWKFFKEHFKVITIFIPASIDQPQGK